MGENGEQDRNVLERTADKVKDFLEHPDLERGLTNQAAAMSAATDMSYAGGESPSLGPGASITPGAEAAAGGSLTDEEPVGEADSPDDGRDPRLE
jgi:hypothetical protein